MQNKRLYILLGIAVLFIGVAAFIAGRMFSRGIGPNNSESGVLGNGQVFVSTNDVTPAPELPTTTPDIHGVFVERKDNTVIVQTVSFDAGPGGIAGNAPWMSLVGRKWKLSSQVKQSYTVRLLISVGPSSVKIFLSSKP